MRKENFQIDIAKINGKKVQGTVKQNVTRALEKISEKLFASLGKIGQ